MYSCDSDPALASGGHIGIRGPKTHSKGWKAMGRREQQVPSGLGVGGVELRSRVYGTFQKGLITKGPTSTSPGPPCEGGVAIYEALRCSLLLGLERPFQILLT